MEKSIKDTIAAIATAPGRGGVAIVRISGDQAADILERLFFPQRHGDWQSHHLYYGEIRNPRNGEILDKCLAVLFRSPASFTGEDVVELQCHGGAMVPRLLLQAALDAGVRLAEPGEFSMRAFVNGAMDLSEAEAICDIVDSKTAAAASVAAVQIAGSLSCEIDKIETELLDIMAAITVAVDFPDDADAPESELLIQRINALKHGMVKLINTASNGRIYREGIRATLCGAVNVGKSSLLNALLQNERAIVSAAPGTTRDIIEECLNIEGVPVIISDTAGLRDALDEAETIGISRSHAVAAASQILMIVIDARIGLDDQAKKLLAASADKKRLVVINKVDLSDDKNIIKTLLDKGVDARDIIFASAVTAEGLPEILSALKNKALAADVVPSDCFISNIRHQQALIKSNEFLHDAVTALSEGLPVDLAAIDLENAWQELGSISGKTASEEIINTIFSKFCLGK